MVKMQIMMIGNQWSVFGGGYSVGNWLSVGGDQ